MKRIVHVSLRYPPAMGGAERYVHDIVEHTRSKAKEANTANEASYDVRVLTSRLRTHGPISELDPNLLLDDPPYVQRLHYARTPFISYPRLQGLHYYLGHHAPDIIHGYGFWYQPADGAAAYAKKHKIPFIFHPIYYDNEIRQKAIWRIYKKTIGVRTFAATDVVAVISPFEQKLLEEAGFPIKRFELLSPGVDIVSLATHQPNPYKRRHIPGNIILAVGRIAKGKGLDEVIKVLPEICKQVNDAQLVIVGEDFGAQTSLRQLVEQLGVTNHVHFLGIVPDTELTALYQHADVFVHPSHYEAFGIVLAESQAAGTPVVARNTSAIPYVAPHNIAGLLFKNNDELTAHLITLLTNTNQRDALAASGRAHVQAKFGWNVTIKKLAQLYEELAPEKTF